MKDIQAFSKYNQVQMAVDKVKRVSFYMDQTQKRFPMPEGMTTQELESVVNLYLSYFKTLEEAYLEMKKMRDEANKPKKTPLDEE